jgi:hypothetical protein
MSDTPGSPFIAFRTCSGSPPQRHHVTLRSHAAVVAEAGRGGQQPSTYGGSGVGRVVGERTGAVRRRCPVFARCSASQSRVPRSGTVPAAPPGAHRTGHPAGRPSDDGGRAGTRCGPWRVTAGNGGERQGTAGNGRERQGTARTLPSIGRSIGWAACRRRSHSLGNSTPAHSRSPLPTGHGCAPAGRLGRRR